jgi:hypothetical protein
MLVAGVNLAADAGIQYLTKRVNKTISYLIKRVGLTYRTKLLRFRAASSHPTLMWGSPTSQSSMATDQRTGKMDKTIQNLKDQSRDRCTPRPDKSEIVDVLYQHGSADGFSLEWVIDRFPQQFGGRS